MMFKTVVFCLFVAISVTVYADSCGKGIKWTLDGSNLIIEGKGYMKQACDLSEELKDKVESIVVKDGVKSIARKCFKNYYSLKQLTLSDSVKVIGESAFEGCSKLNLPALPAVSSIGRMAFAYCYSFRGSFTVSKNLRRIGRNAFVGCYNLDGFNVEVGNRRYESEEGVLFTKGKKVLLMYPSTKNNSSYTIPNTVRVLGDHSFDYNDALESVIIPNSVTTLGEGVFSNYKSLQTVTIPASVTSIKDGCFSYCKVLKHIEIQSPNFVIVDDVLFNKEKTRLIWYSKAKNNTSYTVPGTVAQLGKNCFSGNEFLTDVFLSNNLTRIGSSAFGEVFHLKEITIPASVSSIEDDAFFDCYALKFVTYMGTKDPGEKSKNVFAACVSNPTFCVSPDYASPKFCGQTALNPLDKCVSH